MSSGLPRPRAIRKLGLAIAAVALALFLVGRVTGSGWDVVILCLLLATMVLGLCAPLVALGGLAIAVDAPRDATVGRPARLALVVTGTGRSLRLQVPELSGEWYSLDAPAKGLMRVEPRDRGVFDTLTVEVRCAHALGLVDWSRRYAVALPSTIEVGPRTESFRVGSVLTHAQAADAVTSGARDSEFTRGVRDYVAGDSFRQVHWPATARTGELMVRELEGPKRAQIAIVTDLRGPDAEHRAALAAGAALDALRHGAKVLLSTCEATGPRLGEVRLPLEVSRRLARATTGAPARDIPPGFHTVVPGEGRWS